MLQPSFVLLALSAAFASSSFAAPAPAPLAPAAIAQELRSLGTLGTVLHVGAHPDDENTELITYLARGRGLRAAYLSLTRGDGGQNELGRDFDEKLGVLRTQELLSARQLDTGRQFFTRAIDFGYSKTPEETLAFWDKKEVLGDVVRVIRQFRPDVIVTRFPIPPGSGGHGHHTASAMLAVEAFALAGDPAAYPEQLAQGLAVWQPKRVLWNAFRFGGNADAPFPLPGPTFKQDIAGTDAATGQAFGTIAAHSRAMHKTQGLGGFATRARTGANEQTFLLLAGEPATNDLLDGVDTTWNRVSGGTAIDGALEKIITEFKAENPAASVPALLALRRQLAALPDDPLVADKRAQLDLILRSCLGLRVATATPRAEALPGGTAHLTFTARADSPVAGLRYAGVRTPFTALKFAGGPLAPDEEIRETLALELPADLPLTQPYWLREAGAAGIARVSDPGLIGRPDNPPAVAITHVFEIDGQQLEVADEPVPVARTEAGERHRRLVVIPPVSLTFNAEIFYARPGGTRDVFVRVSAARSDVNGTLRLEVPAGWTVARREETFSILRAGGSQEIHFEVRAPAAGGAGLVRAVAVVDGREYSHQRQELRYEHLPVQLLQPPATARVASFELAVRGRNIGYLPGAGDYVAECLEQMGYRVRALTGADLAPEKLAGLDAVVIGVRAFNERTDLKDHLAGLFAWVEQGGTVIAQYNRPNGLQAAPLAPYELSIEGAAPRFRVTDEKAPVAMLAEHPALFAPNLIGAADFDGWVQERGAYFPSKWDESRFTAPFAMSDPGEPPLRGSLLIARHGRGHYVYTGLAFFRQLPAGNPGAWRLFANLVSLGENKAQ